MSEVFNIEHEEITHDFWMAYQYGRRNLNSFIKSSNNSYWLRDNLDQPFIEHMSFAYGNKIYFIFLYLDGTRKNESYHQLFLERCVTCNAIPCIMTMLFNDDGSFRPLHDNWNLQLLPSGNIIDPAALATEEHIPMTEWELFDFAVHAVSNHILSTMDVLSENLRRQSNIGIDPSIWFQVGEKRSFVIVRQTLYPKMKADRPHNFNEIVKRSTLDEKTTGFFASVSLKCSDNFDEDGNVKNQSMIPCRGSGNYVNFEGLEPIGELDDKK